MTDLLEPQLVFAVKRGMVPFEFTRPAMLSLIVPVAIVLGLWYVRSLSDFPHRQRMVSLAVRGTLALLLVLALSGWTWLHQTTESFLICVVDQSRSIGDESGRQAEEFLEQLADSRGGGRIAYLPFAAETGTLQEVPPRFVPRRSLLPDSGSPEEPASGPGASSTDTAGPRESAEPRLSEAEEAKLNGTNLAAAIEAAAGSIPPGFVPQIVVLSDGNETLGDAVSAAARAGIRVSTVMLPARLDPEVQISAVDVPAEVREGEPFFVDVRIHANHDDEGLVEIFRGDHKVVSETKALKAGENQFRFQQSVENDRMVAFKVRVSGLQQDTLLDNNSDTGLVSASGKPRVLIVESDPNLIQELAYALEDEGIQADVRPPQGMPDSLAGLQNFELLILSNVPATALTEQQMDVVRTWVRDLGGGFIMLGGEQSFGLGGYFRSTLEEILPVRSDFEKEKEKPSLGMVLIIDRSGSMDGEKIEMARSAARAAVELLGNRDQIAVLAFDDQTRVISEMQSAAGKGRISDEIARIEPGGGTSLFPAMEMAYEILNATSAKLKHVIMLTDGISSSGDFEAMARQMASAKMTVSTVAIGGDGETDTQLLETIARVGKGRYYLADDVSQVPQIFAKETVTASKAAIDEQPFMPQVIRVTHALAEVDLESAPFLLGYVMTRPKPTSEVILATEKGDPLLAWWRYGLGMTAAFTSDAKSRWAAEWLTWPGYGKFWTQVVRQCMRKNESRGLQISTSRTGQTTLLTVDAVTDSGQFLNGAEVELTVIDPGLRRTQTLLQQTAPGQYSAEFPSAQSGAWHMELAVRENDDVVLRQSRGLMVGYPEELRLKPANEPLLREVARVSGGMFNPEPQDLDRVSGLTASRPTPLWPWLLSLAACLLVLDVALRRLDVALHWPPGRRIHTSGISSGDRAGIDSAARVSSV